TGNGTVTQELLRIHTNEQNNPSNVQTIPLTFQVDHFEISSETTLQARKSEIQKLNQATNSTINNACYKEYCCGLIQAKENLKLANKFHVDGGNDIKTCKLTSSFSNFVKSLSYAKNASDLSKNAGCTATLGLIQELDSEIKNAETTIADSQNCSLGNATFFLTEAKSKLPIIKIKMSLDSYAEAQNEIDTGKEFIQKSLSSINCSVKSGTGFPIPSLPSNITTPEGGQTCPVLFLLLITIVLFYASKRS
ncbi:hypothetical protein HY570_01660, partial [Candidatus Micrarchaeota archaeon]|nr:hypothetical protein [Candidatus Micrarchaeota archaeon]